MENTDFADESRVLEILQSGAADRAILYFALGLSETQSTSFFNSDWCFKLNVSSAKLDIRHFSLVDQFEAGSHVRYRALLLLDCICSQLSHGAGRSAALALLRSGTDFDCFSCADKSLGVALRNPFFHCCAEDVHNRTGALIASESELKNCSQLLRILRISYARMVNIADAMDGVRDSGLWFVKQESYPSDMDDGTTINVSFMLRHTSIENDPEIIIAIEHTIVEVDKSVADELARELNCDSYVERYVLSLRFQTFTCKCDIISSSCTIGKKLKNLALQALKMSILLLLCCVLLRMTVVMKCSSISLP